MQQSLAIGNNDNHNKEFQISNDFEVNMSNEVILLGIQIQKQSKF